MLTLTFLVKTPKNPLFVSGNVEDSALAFPEDLQSLLCTSGQPKLGFGLESNEKVSRKTDQLLLHEVNLDLCSLMGICSSSSE